MKNAIGIAILILIASFVIYLLLFSYGKIYSDHSLLVETGRPHKIYSMREIDSLSADMNYRFTIKNAEVRINKDSLKTPLKPEIPCI